MLAEAKRIDNADRPCTVSVVSHGQGALLERLLGDLAGVSPSSIAEVVVTRNLPDDRIRVPDGLGFPVRFIDNAAPRGFGANHNAAFATCATPWLAVLNPDLRLAAEPFETLLAAARPDTGMIAPRVLEPDGREADSARQLPTPARLARRLLARLATGRGGRERDDARDAVTQSERGSGGPEWFAGMFMLLRSDALRAVGGFDEGYFMYCEDVDLCARLRLAGWQLQQVREVTVTHEARRASRRSAHHLRWHLASFARLWASPAFRRYRALLAAERHERPVRRMARS